MIAHLTVIVEVVPEALLYVDGVLWKVRVQGKQIAKCHTLGTDGSGTALHAYHTSNCSGHIQLLHL